MTGGPSSNFRYVLADGEYKEDEFKIELEQEEATLIE